MFTWRRISFSVASGETVMKLLIPYKTGILETAEPLLSYQERLYSMELICKIDFCTIIPL
jgi:hypothetical protein